MLRISIPEDAGYVVCRTTGCSSVVLLSACRACVRGMIDLGGVELSDNKISPISFASFDKSQLRICKDKEV